jgi:hypothetical protein
MIRTVFFKLTIDGVGVVNFDSENQKYLWNRMDKNSGVEIARTNNVAFGKATYSRSGDKLTRSPKISADALRHAMWENEMATIIPNVMHFDEMLLNALASPMLVTRGYMFAKDNGTFKRKSPVVFSAAHAEHDIAQLETHSNTTPKFKDDDEKILVDAKSQEDSATSFFSRETRGQLTYRSEGSVDLTELGFISLSDVHGRMALNPDHQEEYRQLLKQRLGSDEDIPAPAYYVKPFDVYKIPEYGIKLTENQVRLLLKDLFQRISSINIQRTTTGYARTQAVDVKLVQDPIDDLFYEDDGWFVVKEAGKRPNLSFIEGLTIDDTYYQVDQNGKLTIEDYRTKCKVLSLAHSDKKTKAKEEAAKKKAAKKTAKK